MSDLDLKRKQVQALQMQMRLKTQGLGGQNGGITPRLEAARSAVQSGQTLALSPERQDRQDQIDRGVERDVTAARQEQIVSDNPVGARLAVTAQGIPFVGEYVDEAFGAIGGEGARDTVRSWQGAMEATRPGETAGLRIAGGIAGSVPLAGPAGNFIARGTGLAGQVARGAGLGAVGGAVEGAVSGYGAGNEGDRGQSAMQRGAFGGVAGGIVGGALPVVATGIKNALQSMRTSDVQTIAREFGVGRDAARVVKAALEAEDFDAAARAIERAGGRAMLADAGEATRGLLDASISTGGAASRAGRQAVNARASAGGREFQQVLDRFLGKPRGVQATQRAVRGGSQAARSDAYAAAYARPIDYSARAGQRLEGLGQRIPSSAIQRANRLMQLEGNESRQIMARIADDGSVSFERLPDVRQWDYITRALGDLSESGQARGAMGGATSESRALTGLQREIRNVLRSQNPDYARALDTARGTIREVKAVEAGADLLRPGTTREAARDAINSMTKAERAAARDGLRSYLDDMMARTSAALTDGDMDAREAIRAWRTLSSRQARDNMEALLGKGRAGAMAKEIDRIATDFELRAAVHQNSKTAIRQAVQGEAREIARPGVLGALQQGEPAQAARRLVQALTGRTEAAQAAREAGLFEEIVDALTQTRGSREAQRIIGSIGEAMRRQPISQSRAENIARLLATGTAGGAYQSGVRFLEGR